MNIAEHLGKRVRCRPHFQASDASLEGELVWFAQHPTVGIRRDDGEIVTIAAELVREVEHTEWRPL